MGGPSHGPWGETSTRRDSLAQHRPRLRCPKHLSAPLFSPQGDVGREGQEGVPGEAGRRVRACSSSWRAGLMGRGTWAVGSMKLLCSESHLLSPGQARQGRTPAPEGPPRTQGTWPGCFGCLWLYPKAGLIEGHRGTWPGLCPQTQFLPVPPSPVLPQQRVSCFCIAGPPR